MGFVPHVLPDAVHGFMRRLSDQALVDGVRAIDAMERSKTTAEHQQSRIWLINEFENRHPEIHEDVMVVFEGDGEVEDEYIDILARFVQGVK